MPATRRAFALSTLAAAALGASATAQPKVKPMRILILGGTGFIGPHQVRHALSRGHKVTVFNRGRRPDDFPPEVEELVGDRNTSDLKALEGKTWDVCIDNPTTLPFWVRDAAKVLKGNVGHYLFVSTMSVYATQDRPGEDETAPTAAYAGADAFAERGPAKPELYGPLKAVSETEARSQFGAGATTIVRPGLIVGPGDETDRFTYWPVRLARGGEVLAPGDGSDPILYVDARDLAEWTIRLVEQRTAGTFNAIGPARPLTTKGLLDGVAKGVGAKPTYVWAPADWLAEKNVNGWSDLPVWLPGQGRTAGFHRRSNAAAINAGLTLRPLETTAADTLAWWKTLPEERRAKPRTGLSPERETALLAERRAKA
ncbi:NAD-dependent epimerase/dehydratase family protein [Phenylobacterium sp.]|uniref:NAD-dependent epimerase/dehydratase family protein n=1 Tax=Phenylobacterium sp. TaxID=1871053 RepID=UPI002ED9AA3E